MLACDDFLEALQFVVELIWFVVGLCRPGGGEEGPFINK